MIVTKQKPLNIILQYLRKDTSVFIIGCDDCAAQCQTGGIKEVEAMKNSLLKEGIAVSGTDIEPSLCHELHTKMACRKNQDMINKADSILVLSCGAGVQSVTEAVECPVRPGCDSMFLGNIARHMHFTRKCSICGDCSLNRYGGICATTRCSKGLMNGPCGGSINGKCEVNSDMDCAWVKIYEKLKSQGRLDELIATCPPRHDKVYEFKRDIQ